MNIRSALPIIGILFLAACRGDSPAAPVGSAALLTLVPDPVLNDEQHAAFTAIRDRGGTRRPHRRRARADSRGGLATANQPGAREEGDCTP